MGGLKNVPLFPLDGDAIDQSQQCRSDRRLHDYNFVIFGFSIYIGGLRN